MKKKTPIIVCLMHRKAFSGKECQACSAERQHCGLCGKRVGRTSERGFIPICEQCFFSLSDEDRMVLQPKPSLGQSATG